MRFDRLNAPQLQLPDLVAFNQRVHERIDPWFARAGCAGCGIRLRRRLRALFAAVWLYFASGLPSSEKLLAYQPPLPTNVRGYDGTPVQTFARERRVELAYDEYPPLVVHAFISAEDKTFFSHGGIDYPGLVGAVFDFTTKTATGGGRAQGRLDHHPAGREISASGQQLFDRPQGARGDPRLPARIHAEQAADPRALPQLHLPRPKRLWRSRPRAAPISTRTSTS